MGMKQSPAAESNTNTLTLLTNPSQTPSSAAPLPTSPGKIRIVTSKGRVALQGITDHDITAQIVCDIGATQALGEPQLSMTISVPTRWIPPTYDEDAEPWTTINPYDRASIFPPRRIHSSRSSATRDQSEPSLNLLDAFQQGADQRNGKIVMERRTDSEDSVPLSGMGGKISSFVREAVMMARKRGTVIRLKHAEASDAKVFLSGAKCPVKMVFRFEPVSASASIQEQN